MTWLRHTDVEIVMVYYGARYGVFGLCEVVDVCWLESWGKTPRVWVMDRFQLTVRREHCPAPMLPCAPVQSVEEGTGVISLGAVGTVEKGSNSDQFPDCAALYWSMIGASFPTRPAQWCPVQLFVRQLCRSWPLVVEH